VNNEVMIVCLVFDLCVQKVKGAPTGGSSNAADGIAHRKQKARN
jgi:hypothetical protein